MCRKTCLLTIALLLPHGVALAENPTAALEAKKACSAGQVDKGIQLLAELLAETGDQIAVYNQGRCYQQNGRPEEAISRFREYLRRGKDLSADDVKELEGFIKELEREIEAKQRSRPSPTAPAEKSPRQPTRAPGPTAAVSPTTPPPLSVTPPPLVSTTARASDTTTAPARSSDSRKLLGVGVAGAGAAAMLAGVYFSLKVRSANSTLDEMRAQAQPIDVETFNKAVDDGKGPRTWQWVMYGTGFAALAAGAALYYLDVGEATAKPTGPKVSLAPALTPDGAGGSLRVVF